MMFLEVLLAAGELGSLYEFYAGDLALPVVRRSVDALTLQIGVTHLTFKRGDKAAFYHFAFNVHPKRFERARARVAAVTPLLHDENGEEVFKFHSWNARACYFLDPAGNIVELIARKDLDSVPLLPDPGLLSVSELGLVSNDVPALTARITRDLGLEIYRDSAGDTFAALGDPHGLLILVQRGRIWYPDTGKAAVPAAALCRFSSGDAIWQVEGPPYQFTSLSS